jgi:hypothetical protein
MPQWGGYRWIRKVLGASLSLGIASTELQQAKPAAEDGLLGSPRFGELQYVWGGKFVLDHCGGGPVVQYEFSTPDIALDHFCGPLSKVRGFFIPKPHP